METSKLCTGGSGEKRVWVCGQKGVLASRVQKSGSTCVAAEETCWCGSNMPLAPRSPAPGAKMQTTMSAWTPLNHPLSNHKVFAERRTLLAKWFDRWSDSQRRAVLQDFVLSCSSEQLVFLSLSVSRQLPLQAADFSCLLPRALCLYLFSFLDPRSLSRCARVSWHWKSIVELDQLWMPKCLRLGWCISFSPTPFEQGVWKRHYIQSVQELQRLTSAQAALSRLQLVVPHAVSDVSRTHEELSEVEGRPASSSPSPGGVFRVKQPAAPPPWRDADRRPKDTLRFNYLDNLEPSGAAAVPMNFGGSTCLGNTSKKSLSEANYKLRKAKSLMLLSSDCRPQHPPPHPTTIRPDHPVAVETAESILCAPRWGGGMRPGPVRSAVPRLSAAALRASQRSQRSAPNAPLFEAWTAPHT